MGRAVQIDAIIGGITDPNTGLPAAGGTIEFYVPGTTTGKNVWTEAAKSNAYTSYTLNVAGAAHLYADGIYDVVVKNSSGTTIYEWDGLRLRYPDYQVTTVSENYTQTTDDDSIVVSASATGAVSVTLLDSDDWEDKPLVVVNSNASYAVTIYPESGSGQTIDGDASKSLPVGSSALTIFKSGDDFYTSGGPTSAISATDGSGRSVKVDEDGAYDESPDFSSTYFLLGSSTTAARIICARLDISYSAASAINVTISSTASYGFGSPPTVSSGSLTAGGSANGVSVGSGGAYISLSNSIAYSNAADDADFCGAFPASIPVYDKTTSGVPAALIQYTSSALFIYYYEDGVSANIISALASSGDDLSIIIMYAMSPTA